MLLGGLALGGQTRLLPLARLLLPLLLLQPLGLQVALRSPPGSCSARVTAKSAPIAVRHTPERRSRKTHDQHAHNIPADTGLARPSQASEAGETEATGSALGHVAKAEQHDSTVTQKRITWHTLLPLAPHSSSASTNVMNVSSGAHLGDHLGGGCGQLRGGAGGDGGLAGVGHPDHVIVAAVLVVLVRARLVRLYSMWY